ncbi:MAG: hypothetical protein HRU14_17785, partial [Planctomycetes bacterium]|nr:hypothetical protein [Planctomycetota bacterium]
SGIVVPDAAVERWFKSQRGLEPDAELSLPEQAIELQRTILAIAQFRAQFIRQDPGGTPFSDLLDEYQRTYSTFSAKVILLDKREPESFALDLGKEEDRAKVKAWFDKNGWVATTNKKAESADVEFVYVRLRDQGIEAFK